MSAKSEHRAAVLARDGARCALKSSRCRGRLQAAHVVPVKRIIEQQGRAQHVAVTVGAMDADRWNLANAELDDLIADPRNGKMLCEWHHNETEGRADWLAPEDRDRVLGFTTEYGLDL